MARAPNSAGTGVPEKRGCRPTELGPATGASSSTTTGGGVLTCITLRALGRPTHRGTAFPLFAARFPRVAGWGGGMTGAARECGAGTCSGRHFRIGSQERIKALTLHDHLLAHFVVAHAPPTYAIGQPRTGMSELGALLAYWNAPC